MDLLLDEIAATAAGDNIHLGIYLLEGGTSSERVLAALEQAGRQRGVRVTFGLDVSYVSEISRIIEKTDTLIPYVARLADTQAEWCSCVYGSKPDHGKFALFSRSASDAPDTAILGGINFGDRFKEWDDFAVRLEGEHAEGLRRSLLEGDEAAAAALQGGAMTEKQWMANAPSVEAARVIAYASPAVAFATTVTAAALTCTAGVGLPLALLSGGETTEPLKACLTASIWSGSVAAVLGTAFATACDGAPFSLPRELQGFARSLVFDRSLLGDTLAPLRRLYLPQAPELEANTNGAGVGEWRYLPASLPLPTAPVAVVCNRRQQKRYEIEPTFRALFADPSLRHYRVAMAYLGHRWGVELLEYALSRGATVELLLPRRANVYASENLKAAQALLDKGYDNLALYLHPEMVHAKATLARPAAPLEEKATAAGTTTDVVGVVAPAGGGNAGASVGEESQDEEEAQPVAAAGNDEGAVAFLGSANLVRGSMNNGVHCGLLPYDELNVLIREEAFCAELDASMDALFARARRVPPGTDLLAEQSEWYSERRAQWEELWQ